MEMSFDKGTVELLSQDTIQKAFNLTDTELRPEIKPHLKAYGDDRTKTIHYIVLDLETVKPETLPKIIEDLGHMTQAIRIAQKKDDLLNHGYSPVKMAVGRSFTLEVERSLLDNGAIVFDLDQPCNKNFTNADSLVFYLEEMTPKEIAIKPQSLSKEAPASVDPAVLAHYYSSVEGEMPIRELLAALNSPDS